MSGILYPTYGCRSAKQNLLIKFSKSSDTNATSLGHEIGNVIFVGDNSANGEISINPTDNTINNVNGDKDSGVSSRITKPDVMGDFCIGKPSRGTRSSFENNGPEMLNDVDVLSETRANISNTNSINATSLERGKGKVISIGDNSGKGKNLVNHDKFIGVDSKKKVQNTFPSNVRSLLSSGLLDGVPVKYISMSSDKSLIGVIKGNGYLCSCDNCKSSEKKILLSAMEFERHAGCKSNHANNHIFFDSGITILAVVQKLKKTPTEMIFEVIQW
ncbi:uncharacterized protein LOC107016434 [Solanum pennellii]|uniref:Uncharacterized protein LOC107016434 n=1 Tax=Solanum pennellii TaxID=28526 RepID=A0ABM1GKN7_SOLPN|nr:uncharacterized protein LOC107016434 [Solanum pennellii]